MANWSVQPLSNTLSASRAQVASRAVMLIVSFAFCTILLSAFTGSHIVYALLVIPLVVVMAWTNPVAMIGLLPIWMVLMGFLRRITPGGGNSTFSGDPVIMVGPVAILVLFAVSATSDRDNEQFSPLAKIVLLLNVMTLIQAFNPGQHSLMTGMGGLLFILIPSLSFWVGRRFSNEQIIERLMWVIAFSSLGVAIYGLFQQFVGFPSWDSAWVGTDGYTALNVGNGVVRAFGTSSSAQEYALFLAVGVITWVALGVRGSRVPLIVRWPAIVTVAVALYYESQRTSVFLCVLALGIMFAAHRRWRPLLVGMAGVGSIVLLVVFAGFFGNSPSGNGVNDVSTAQQLSNHQLSGLTDPNGSNSSLSGHIKIQRKGIVSGFAHPLGYGTGSVTISATRYSRSANLHGTEYDPGNMAVAFGVLGIGLYLFLLRHVFRTSYRLAIARNDSIGLFVMGISAVTIFQWINGDLYSVCWLFWFALGCGDQMALAPATKDVAVQPMVATSWEWRRPGEARRTISLS